MKKLLCVYINGRPYTVARRIEDMAEALGGYNVYVFDGETAGPRHPGTVVVNAVRSILKDPVLRRQLELLPTNQAKVEFGVHKPNDNLINYMIHQRMITKFDMDQGMHYLNVFDLDSAEAVLCYLRKNLSYTMHGNEWEALPRKFDDIILSTMILDKDAAKRKKNVGSLF